MQPDRRLCPNEDAVVAALKLVGSATEIVNHGRMNSHHCNDGTPSNAKTRTMMGTLRKYQHESRSSPNKFTGTREPKIAKK
jgi:hypothetical protein